MKYLVLVFLSLFTLAASATEGRQVGVVKWYNVTKGYGFIVPLSGGADEFVKSSSVQRSGLQLLEEGDCVEYLRVRDKRTGKFDAQDLILLDPSACEQNFTRSSQ